MTKMQMGIATVILLAAGVAGAYVAVNTDKPAVGAAVGGEEALLKRFLVEMPKTPVEAEDFTAYPINGSKPHLHDYRGKYILLNFWATWCGPCKVEMPALDELYRALREKNFVVLAVSMSEEVAHVQKFIDSTDYAFPVLADPDGTVSMMYGVDSIPLTYLIDPDGWIVGRALGPREWNDPEMRAYFEARSAAP